MKYNLKELSHGFASGSVHASGSSNILNNRDQEFKTTKSECNYKPIIVPYLEQHVCGHSSKRPKERQ